MIKVRGGCRRLAVTVGAALILTLAPIATGPAYADAQVGTYTIGKNLTLYRSTWGAPVAVHRDPAALPGAAIALLGSGSTVPRVFAINASGALVMWSTSTGAGGQTSVEGPGGQALPGTSVTAAGTEVFFVGRYGAIYNKSYRAGTRVGPRQITAVGVAAPGAVVAAIPGSTVGVAFVGIDGAVRVVRQNSAGTWMTSLASPPNFAVPGGGLAVIGNAAGMVTDTDGRIWQVRLTGGPVPDPWQPVAVAGVGAAPPGAHLATGLFSGSLAVVMFAGEDGAIRATSNVNGTWHEPTPVTNAGVAIPGRPIALTVHGDHLHGDWCGNSLAWQVRIPRPVPWPGPHPEPWNATTYSFQAPNIQPGGYLASLLL
ncbi:hypothetical protein [Micromonospora sp. NPDC047134]|uniref:hypothetical protein n=1 Tax=Micromonospora sp. NPDC047134 TaxID=3154340 RepID=UPI0033D648AC